MAPFFPRLLRLLTRCCWRIDESTQLTGTERVGTLGDRSHLLLLAHTCPHQWHVTRSCLLLRALPLPWIDPSCSQSLTEAVP